MSKDKVEMRKPTISHTVKALEYIDTSIELNLCDSEWGDIPAEVKQEVRRIQADLDRKRKNLLAPPQPKQPRKPKAAPAVQDSKLPPLPLPLDTGNVIIPVPTGLQHSSDAITKRGRK